MEARMSENAIRTLDRYREVVALSLESVHDCPPEVIAELMDYYAGVIRGSWRTGTAPVDVIKLLYAEWKTFRSIC